MATEDIKITSEVAELVIKLLDEKLSDNKRRAYPMPDIFKSLEKEIKAVYPDTDRYKFQKALSAATKAGEIRGYEVKLGKNGGLGKVDYKKPGTEAVPVTVVRVPAEPETSALEFNGRGYRVSLPKDKLEKLLTKVFKVQENSDGDLVFDDRHFITDSAEIREQIDNFLFYFETEEANHD